MYLFKLLFLSLLLTSSCSRQSAPPASISAGKIDTVFIPDPQCQALLEQTAIERDSFASLLVAPASNVALQVTNDSLYATLLVANYKLERVRFYSNIVSRNPSQVKFLRGWINRVLEE